MILQKKGKVMSLAANVMKKELNIMAIMKPS